MGPQTRSSGKEALALRWRSSRGELAIDRSNAASRARPFPLANPRCLSPLPLPPFQVPQRGGLLHQLVRNHGVLRARHEAGRDEMAGETPALRVFFCARAREADSPPPLSVRVFTGSESERRSRDGKLRGYVESQVSRPSGEPPLTSAFSTAMADPPESLFHALRFSYPASTRRARWAGGASLAGGGERQRTRPRSPRPRSPPGTSRPRQSPLGPGRQRRRRQSPQRQRGPSRGRW